MASWEWEPETFQIVCGVLGTFTTALALLSYLIKERLFISEALLALLAGVAVSYGANFIRPLEYAGNEAGIATINLHFTRLVLCIQVFITGWQLPAQYIRNHWRSLLILVGPAMGISWIISSLLIWALTSNVSFLECLIAGACVCPTDPVLANTVIKGRFADEQIPPDMAQLIAAESGANDGLGYPFVFLGLWLFKARQEPAFSAGEGIGYWFADTWVYVVLLSVVWGAVFGLIGGKALKLCYSVRYVERESFHAFPVFLVLLLIGTCGLVGSDDILSCFVAGNVISWDDWFREQTMDDSFQPTLDMMLNQAMFLWLGAVCPWPDFTSSGEIISLGRLVALGFLILILRRPPVIACLHYFLGEVERMRNALYMGYFGPVGVSAIFYLYESLEFLESNVEASDVEAEEQQQRLRQMLLTVVWFIVIFSTIVFGVSISALQASKYVAHKMRVVHRDEPKHYSLREWKDKEIETLRHGHFHARGGHHPHDGLHQAHPDLPLPLKEVGWRRIRHSKPAHVDAG
ncbi:hypothetical protein MBLNU230_g5344t1 [Neophaeotheca triangularis]